MSSLRYRNREQERQACSVLESARVRENVQVNMSKIGC
jgi:hypothetical protein